MEEGGVEEGGVEWRRWSGVEKMVNEKGCMLH